MTEVKEYRVVKAYLMLDGNRQLPHFASVLSFQQIWHSLTKPQRAALAAKYWDKVRKVTLDRLAELQLIKDGSLTLLGEAVLHYAPEAKR